MSTCAQLHPRRACKHAARQRRARTQRRERRRKVRKWCWAAALRAARPSVQFRWRRTHRGCDDVEAATRFSCATRSRSDASPVQAGGNDHEACARSPLRATHARRPRGARARRQQRCVPRRAVAAALRDQAAAEEGSQHHGPQVVLGRRHRGDAATGVQDAALIAAVRRGDVAAARSALVVFGADIECVEVRPPAAPRSSSPRSRPLLRSSPGTAMHVPTRSRSGCVCQRVTWAAYPLRFRAARGCPRVLSPCHAPPMSAGRPDAAVMGG